MQNCIDFIMTLMPNLKIKLFDNFHFIETLTSATYPMN